VVKKTRKMRYSRALFFAQRDGWKSDNVSEVHHNHDHAGCICRNNGKETEMKREGAWNEIVELDLAANCFLLE
jgi:hypothetical protein